MLPRTRNGNPRLRLTDDVNAYYVEHLLTVDAPREHVQSNSLSYDGDNLYHYGHWTLAHGIRNARGKTTLVVLNGDRYGGSGGWGPNTDSRGRDIERAVANAGIPHIRVPFSALNAAGINLDSIRPIEVLDSRYTTTYHEEDEVWASCHLRALPDGGFQTYLSQALGNWVDVERLPNGNYLVPRERHWLGEALFSGEVHWDHERAPTAQEIADSDQWVAWRTEDSRLNGIYRSLRMNATTFEDEEARRDCWHARKANQQPQVDNPVQDVYGTRPRRVVVEHRVRRAKFLSAFDHNELRECYFLCELPRTQARTVDEAFDALRPPAVVRAIDAGLRVLRQGDVFAIPTSLRTRDFGKHAVAVKNAYVLDTNHTATRTLVKDELLYASGMLRHRPRESWRPPDHAPLKLGDGWYRLIKNTVPTAYVRTGNANAFQSGSSRAWTMGGQVD